MTKPLYEKLLERKLESYENEVLGELKSLAPSSSFEVPSDISRLIIFENNLVDRIKQIEHIEINQPVINLKNMISDYYKSEIQCYEDSLKSIKEDKTRKIDKLKKEKEDIILSREKDLNRLISENMKQIEPYIERHNKLKDRRGELEDIFRLYCISVNEYNVKTNELSLEEINELLELGEYAIGSLLYNKNPINKCCQLLYLPLVIDLKEETLNNLFIIMYFISMILVCLFVKPILSIISVMYMINIISNVARVLQRKELLQATYAISEDIDFKIFVKDTEQIIEARKRLEEAKHFDISEQEEKVSADIESSINELEDPNNLMDSELARATLDLSNGVITALIQKSVDKCVKYKEEIISIFTERLDQIREALEKVPKEFLGDNILETDLFTPILRKGIIYSGFEPISEVQEILPFGSIGFLYSDDRSRDEALSYLKLVLANFICNINPKQLLVDIYDVDGLGSELSEFLTSKSLDFIKCTTDGFDKLFSEIKEGLENNINNFGISDIQEYNKEAIKIEKTTIKYRLLIIISGVKLEDNPTLLNFIISKQQQGLLVMFLYKDFVCFKDEQRNILQDLYSKIMVSRQYGKIIGTSGEVYGEVDNLTTSYTYERKIGEKVMSTYNYLLEKRADPIVLYKENYQEKIIPRDKFWTYNTLMGIEARFGFVDGDPTKAEYQVFGDDTPHALVVGRTGAGKSVFLNNCLANMMLMYSPEWLSLVMVDFKNTEFFIFQGDFSIPQAKVVAGTTDGEYAKSIFKYLDDEMARRNEHFLAFGCKNIVEYNKLIMGGGIKDVYSKAKDKWYRAVIMPRILFVADEFQVMFNKVDSKSLRAIEMYIVSLSKVARSAGCHLLFASQSMTGTMSADILNQFKLRIALACDEKLSSDILGNPAASKIDRKGYSYTNDSGGTNPNANKYWRTPFIETEVFKNYIKELNEKCIKENINKRTYRVFDEKEQFENDMLNEWLNREEIKNDDDLFILGEPTFFDVNKYPPNFKLFKENSENIIYGTYDTGAFLNGINTLIANIKSKDNTEIIISCLDNDISSLLNAKGKITPKYKMFLDNEKIDLELFFELLETTIDKREAEPNLEYPRLYFFAIGWERMEGLGENMRMNTESRFKKLLDRAPKYGIHFIIASKDISTFKCFKKNIYHRIGSKLDSASARIIEDNDKLTDKDLMPHIAIYSTDQTEVKFKLYKFPVEGVLKSRELKEEIYD